MKTYQVKCTGPFAYSEPVNTLKDARRVAHQMLRTQEEGVRITILLVTDTPIEKYVVHRKQPASPPSSRVGKTDPEALLKKVQDTKIADLDLGPRIEGILSQLGIQTMWELLKYREIDLLKVKNFGRKSLRTVRDTLAKWGLRLQDDFATTTQ